MVKGKRRYKRYMVDLMQIGGRMVRTSKVVLLGMVSGEVTLRADMRLEIGREYSLEVTENDRIMSIKGTIVSSSLSGTIQGAGGDVVPQYKAILKTTNPSKDVMRRVTALIKEEAAGEGLKVEEVRVFVGGAKTAILDFPQDYRTKTINLGGMLIEASNSAETEQILPMEIIIPGGSSIRFQGRVANCLLIAGSSPERYDIGIEFSDMTEQDRARLKEFISVLDNHQS
ncbi:MAG: PilZ domain-containing protein [Thermodesulfovibrionales bacterium]